MYILKCVFWWCYNLWRISMYVLPILVDLLIPKFIKIFRFWGNKWNVYCPKITVSSLFQLIAYKTKEICMNFIFWIIKREDANEKIKSSLWNIWSKRWKETYIVPFKTILNNREKMFESPHFKWRIYCYNSQKLFVNRNMSI